MEHWLLISNCQTHGLANAFQMVNSSFHVTPVDIWAFKAKKQDWTDKFGDFFRVVISPEIETIDGVDWSRVSNLTRIPPISFSGYHPDCNYVFGRDGVIHGPLDTYHSLIILAAFERGLSEKDAADLFNGQFYERVGYLDYWTPQRDRLINEFARFGFDISADIRQWGRQEAWMHTIDHPKIRPLYSVARTIMQSMGVPEQGSRIMPPDNLTIGSCWAVYPEIGEHLGVPGSMRFKRFNDYHHIGLDQMIAEFYAVYERQPAGSMHLIGEARPAYDRILENIG